MSLNATSKSSSIVGGPITKEVATQLEARKKVVKNPSINNDLYLNFTNGSTGWVRISSSVDILTPTKIPSSTLAESNVLLGGTLSYGGGLKQGIYTENSSYDFSSLGARPMAGITGFTVENRNYAGALRSGAFELTVTSMEQLSELEQLYMRPGFTILIEYGHSIFVQNSGHLSTNNSKIKDYFSIKSRQEIIDKGTYIRDKITDFNYDFMYAYITNFTWQSSEVGLYDVSVSFVTSGDLIDSLSAAITGGSKIKPKSDASVTLKDQTTSLHTLLWYINHSDTEKYFDRETLEQDEDYNARLQCIDTALEEFCSPAWKDIKQSFEEKGRTFELTRVGIGNAKKQNSWFRYVSMAFLLECMNNLFIPKTENQERLFKFNIEKASPFTTFKQHVCLDPQVAFLPKVIGSTADTNFKFLFAEQNTRLKDETDILNIGINIDYILELLNSLLDSQEFSDASIYKFIHSILKRLSFELGGINDFDLHFDDDNDEYYIIDRTVLPSVKEVKDDSYKLDIFGLGTTVEEFNLGSTVPSSMSAMVAASAGTNSSDLRNKLHSMFRWNEGLIDRTVGTLVLDEEYNDSELDTLREELILLARYYYNINVSPYIINYDEANFKGIRSLHRKITSIFLEYYTNSPEKPEDKLNASGLIPISLQLRLKGISGLKVGQAFTIQDDLLPTRYRGRVAFLINHLSNTISENRWTTEISAMMFSIDIPEDTSNELQHIPAITVEDLEREFENLTPPPPVDYPEVEFGLPLPTLSERNDTEGLGRFGASRDSGTRLHQGWDILAEPETIVKAPITGTIDQQRGFGNYNHPYLKITGTGEFEGFEVLLGYCKWINPPSILQNEDGSYSLASVTKGQNIGVVTDLTKYGGYSIIQPGYPEGIENHIHLKVLYDKQVIDPSKLTYA